ncbi:MAG: hypothetical protein IPP35_06850 [Elusimicrobia bacterium]|nr:hypothetical protein [Elusimicrobiota bacterium]
MGQSLSPPFQFLHRSTGTVTLQAHAVNFPAFGLDRYAYYSFDVLGEGAGFSSLNARTTSQPSTATATAVTISPDRDGADDTAVLSVDPPAGVTFWEAVISSETSFGPGVVRRFYGQGQNDVYWSGDGWEGRTVPNGLYYARFQTEGLGLVSSTVTVTVQAASLKGFVRNSNTLSPLANVTVNVFGQRGGGYGLSAADGSFFVSGLAPNQTYAVQLSRPGFAQLSLSTQTNTATLDLGVLDVDPGAEFHCSVSVSSGPSRDIYGRASVRASTATHSANGNLHLGPGSILTDNGFPIADPLFSTFTVLSVLPNLDYTIEVDLPEYGHVNLGTLTAPPAGSSVDISTSLVRKANLSGLVVFPAALNTPYNGEWVSVDAALSTAPTRPVAWGGAGVPNGLSTGTFHLFGMDAGTYILRASVRGFATSTQTVTVGAGDLFNLDFPVFGTGGIATGTITVTGNSSALGIGGGGGCPANQFSLFINAFSRTSFTNAYWQQCVPTSLTSTSASFQITGLKNETYDLNVFLPGFQMWPAGSQQVTVTGGVGRKDLLLKALTGRLDVVANIPAGDLGAWITYQLNKEGPDPIQRSGVFSGSPTANASISGLGTGLYRLTVTNTKPGRGLIRTVPVAVTNGSVSSVTVDMTVPTFAIGGSVDVQGNVVLGSTWNVTVSSVSGLDAAGVRPELAVYAYPLPNYFDERLTPLRQVPIFPHVSSGSFLVTGLTPGGYFLRLTEDANPPTPPANCGGCRTPGLPELASSGQVVFIGTSNVAGIPLTVTNGATLSGVIQRPAGDASQESRHLVLRLRRADNLSLWQTETNTSGTGTADYRFSHLASGDYILEVVDDARPPKYAAASTSVRIANADVTQNVTLVAGGTIIALLRDADTGTLLTAENARQFLSDSFEIAAEAVPWVPGGWAQAERDMTNGGYAFDAQTGVISIPRLIPDTSYNVFLRGHESLGEEARAQGRRTYAPTVLSGVRVQSGEVLDLGTIDLNQGGALSGTVRNKAGQALPNIRVQALPSVSNHSDRTKFMVETFTDGNGIFQIDGIDRSQKFYDVVASPRFQQGETFSQLSGKRYGEERVRMLNVNDPLKTTGISFSLEEANASLVGRVVPNDGGPLIPVFGDLQNQAGVRGADLVLHRDGAPLGDDPLGEIEERSAADGTFRIDGLRPGGYTIRAIALGYATAIRGAVLSNGATANAGTIVLGKGASVSGTIVKPDGSSPSRADVDAVVGVDDDFKDFVFGRVDADSDTGLVTGYELSGFSVGKPYSILILSKTSDIVEAASNVTFESSTETKVVPLIFRPAPPKVFVNQTRSGNTYTLRFFSSQPLRNTAAADNQLEQIVMESSGTSGAITARSLSASRDSLTVTFDANPAASSFGLDLAFYTDTVDPDDPTGADYRFTQTFTFYTGIGLRRSVGIPNVTGGDCTLEGVATGASFPSGAFDVASSSTIEVGILSAETADGETLPHTAPRIARGPALSSAARRLGPAAFPAGGLFAAVSAAADVNPFSAFYDVFLPAGVRRALKKEAQLTLKYADDVTDPSKINVYYFDPQNNVFLLEKSGRTIDDVNKTITVGVSHLSTFVVLPSQASIVQGGAFAGSDILVHNVPNPFNLDSKLVSLVNGGSTTDRTTDGTLIKVALPAGKSGTLTIEIFDVAGALVREMTETAAGGTYSYIEWDGRNGNGKKVASGVYLGRLTVNGGDERFFKMVVVK